MPSSPLTIPLGPFQTNAYVVWKEKDQAILIDPAAEAEHLASILSTELIRPKVILCTHCHMDHISAAAQLQKEYSAIIGMHPLDLEWAFTEDNEMPPFFSVPEKPQTIERKLAEGQEFNDGGLGYRVIETPGHSPGSVSFYFEEQHMLFCGDTLFQGSVGRTDFRGGNPHTLKKSLDRLAELPDETVVFPGHGPSTTIGREKKTNFFMR